MPRLEAAPEPLDFYRDWVAPNRPCVIRNALGHWAALGLWSPAYLRYRGPAPSLPAGRELRPWCCLQAEGGVKGHQRGGHARRLRRRRARRALCHAGGAPDERFLPAGRPGGEGEAGRCGRAGQATEPRRRRVQERSQGAVFYVQKQCSNLPQELPELLADVEAHVPWMSAALGERLRPPNPMTPDPAAFTSGFLPPRKATRRRQLLARRGGRRHVQ